MSISVTKKDNKHIISVKGRFDFSIQSDFRRAYEQAQKNATFVIDFSGTDYMDSSALGMLLLLRDYAGGQNASIEIANAGKDIKTILEISNFGKIFKIL
jgi:anti-anti-sigma factor